MLFRSTGVYVLPDGAGNAMASVAAASYTVRFAPGKAPDIDMPQALSRFLEKERILIIKEGKKGPREVDIRPGIYVCRWEQDALQLLVDASSAGNIKPVQILEALLGDNGQTLAENALLITREELYGAVDSAGERQLLPLGEMR